MSKYSDKTAPEPPRCAHDGCIAPAVYLNNTTVKGLHWVCLEHHPNPPVAHGG